MEKWVEIMNNLENESATLKKIRILEVGLLAYPELEIYLKMVFNTQVLNLDSTSIEKYLSIETKRIFKDIGEKLKYYLDNQLTNKSLIETDNQQKTFNDFIVLYKELSKNRDMSRKQLLNDFFLNCDSNDAKWYSRCLVKDLSCGVSIATINKALIRADKKPIQKFGLQLAVALGNDKIEEKIQKIIDENNGECYCENKEDGCRLAIRNINGYWEALSRNGKPILNVDNLLYECERIFGDTKVEIDGELIAENFYSLSTTIHRKNDTQTIIPRTFQVFDITYYKEDISYLNFLDRRKILMDIFSKEENQSNLISTMNTYTFTNVKDVLSYFNQQVEKGEEGIIIKINKPYTRKREFWYKLKPVHTYDLKIVGFEYEKYIHARNFIKESNEFDDEDEEDILIPENERRRNVIIVEDKSGKLKSKVGSGLKEDDIELFSMGEESDWIGKIVEVACDSLTPVNKDGIKSLRFPRFIRLRDDKNEVDSI